MLAQGDDVLILAPARRGEFEIIEADLRSGDYRHVVVEADSLDEAHHIAGAFLADPLGVPMPDGVRVKRIRLIEPVNLTPGVDVFFLFPEELDVMDVDVNGAWSASLGNGVVQAFLPRSGLHLLEFSIPYASLDWVTPLDPVSNNVIEWVESTVQSPELDAGRVWMETT